MSLHWVLHYDLPLLASAMGGIFSSPHLCRYHTSLPIHYFCVRCKNMDSITDTSYTRTMTTVDGRVIRKHYDGNPQQDTTAFTVTFNHIPLQPKMLAPSDEGGTTANTDDDDEDRRILLTALKGGRKYFATRATDIAIDGPVAPTRSRKYEYNDPRDRQPQKKQRTRSVSWASHAYQVYFDERDAARVVGDALRSRWKEHLWTVRCPSKQ